MLVKPSVTELLTKTNNRYELVNIVSKRARQIVEGDAKLVDTEELSPITVATIEVDDEKVKMLEENSENDENNMEE